MGNCCGTPSDDVKHQKMDDSKDRSRDAKKDTPVEEKGPQVTEDEKVVADETETKSAEGKEAIFAKQVAKDKEVLDELFADTEKVTTINWEWLLVQPIAVRNMPKDFIANPGDPQITIAALGAQEPPVRFYGDKKITEYEFPVVWNEDSPKFYVMGMVAWDSSSPPSELKLILKDKDKLTADDLVIEDTVPIPSTSDEWVKHTVKKGDTELDIEVLKSSTPLFTEDDQKNMDLTEEIFTLKNGEKASLAYNVKPENTKAMLYFPGRNDSFAHPHVFEAYVSRGYDVYSIDCRKCGRTRRFMEDPKFGHTTENFDEYFEEIDMAMDFIKKKKEYAHLPLAHAHSTGAPIVLNYVMSKAEDPFSGYVLNSPFCQWGHVGGDLQEFLLEHEEIVRLIRGGLFNKEKRDDVLFSAGKGLSRDWTKGRILFNFDPQMKPLIQSHVTADWVGAFNHVCDKIKSRKSPITTKPTLLISSWADETLIAQESIDTMKYIAADHAEKIFDHNTHDVTQSYTKEQNDLAIAAMEEFLDSNEF